MTTAIKLTDTQAAILKLASYRPDGDIEPLPPTLRGGARQKVINALLAQALVVASGDNYLLTDAGYAAVGRKRKSPAAVTPAAKAKAPVSVAKANKRPQRTEQPAPRTRENTKQQRVIEMLQRPGGSTIEQITEETQWQSHTVRGFFAGTLRKKLGFNLASEKINGHRHYRIV